jgi:exodeoxyribonuclease V alpha subunit
MKMYIKGNFRKYIFRNNQGYVIGLFKVRDTNNDALKDYKNKTITFTGYFHDLNEDDTYMFFGELVDHARYGIQFQVSEYERVQPEDKDGIVEFLSSDLFKGLGEKTAIKIVETLGNDCLKLIIDDYNNLLSVPTMTLKIALKTHNTLLEYEESHQTIVYLFELGFTMKDAMSIYNKYRSNTKEYISNNLYQLIEDFDDITFNKVDSIRNKLNISNNDDRRIEAAIIWVMGEMCNILGHTYLLKEEIINNTLKYLDNIDITNQLVETGISSLISKNKIINKDNSYYLEKLYKAEENTANVLSYLCKKEPSNIKNIDKYITQLEAFFELEYNDKQKQAIKKSINNHITIITGGPGTGKTTIIKAIVELYKMVNDLSYEALISDIALLAPTGRASKRMSEATLLPALTIHRFLKWNKENNSFAINEHNKSTSKFIIIDEASMIDTFLLDSLLKGLTKDIKIILVGDYNQLPSVGPGQILKDIIESDMLDIIKLENLYRQQQDSSIITLACDIKNGNTDLNYINNNDDYNFIECSSFDIKNQIKKVCEDVLKTGYNYKNLQILVPLYKGENGIDNINKMLQEVFNPKSSSKKELVIGDATYRENDKILQLNNMIDENIFNGDIGIIEKIENTTKKEIYINFDGNIIKYTPSNFLNIKHGYAISIHKAQGSEIDMVILPLSLSYNKMLYRKLLYTGVTRGKKKLILIGEKKALEMGILNNETNIRRTSLKDILVKKIIDV